MKLYVWKYPPSGDLAACVEAEVSPDPQYDEMTVAEFEAWKTDALLTWTSPVRPEPVPWAISNADLRRGLAARGVNPEWITAHLKLLPEGEPKWAALADWEYANYFERAHPLLDSLAPAFGLTPQEIDLLFIGKPAYPSQTA